MDTTEVLSTTSSLPLFIVRMALAIMLFPHGAQKAFGWFNGPGFKDSMYYFTKMQNLPAAVGLLVIIVETAGSVLLFFGIGTRVVAFSILLLFCGITKVLVPNGFFMNWTGQQKGEGVEFSLLVFGIALALVIGGGGSLSLDLLLFN